MPTIESEIGSQIERGAYRDAEIKIRSLLKSASGETEELELRASLAQVLFRLGRSDEALEEADRVLKKLPENGSGHGPPSGAAAPGAELRFRVIAIGADALIRLEREDEAEKNALAARKEADRVLGAINLPSGHLSHVLGSIMLERGDLDGALRELTRALEIRDKLLKSPNLDLAATLGELAVVCRRRGDLHRARLYLERAHSIKEQLLGAEHPELAKSLNSLALLGVEEGSDRQSIERLFIRAIAYAERGGHESAREIGVYLINLGSFYRTDGRLFEARSAFERGVTARERSLGPQHRSTAIARYHLGLVLFELGQFPEARKTLEDAKTALEARPKSVEYARAVVALGRVLLIDGELQEANQLFDRAWVIRKELHGPENRETRLAESYCALALARRGGVAEAMSRARAAADQELQNRAEPTQSGAMLIANYGLILKEKGHRRRAVKVLRSSLTALEKVLGAGHPESVDTMVSLASVLTDLGRLDEAESLLSIGVEVRRSVTNGQHRSLPDHDRLLGQVLTRQGRPEDAFTSYRHALEGDVQRQKIPPVDCFDAFEYSAQASGRLEDAGRVYSKLIDNELERSNVPLATTIRTRRALSRIAAAIEGSGGGSFDDAIVDLRTAMVSREKALGPHHPLTVEARSMLSAAETSKEAGHPSGPLADELAHLGGAKPRRVLVNMSTLVISLFLFILSVGSGFSREGLILLVGVLLLHELGHLVAMWLFRYRNLSILFLPFLGAVAVGRRQQPTQFQRVMVYLAGPVPGVVLGLALYALYMKELKPDYARAASVLFLVNGFNLLPLMPLDGGRVVNDLLLERRPRAAAMFGIIGGIILSAWGWQSGSTVLLIYGALCAVPLVIGYRERIFQGQILRVARDELRKDHSGRSQPDETSLRNAILRTLKPLSYNGTDALKRYRLAHSVHRVLKMPVSSFMTVVSLVVTYLLWLAIAIAFASALGRKGAFVENRVMQLVDSGKLDEAIRIAADNAEQSVLSGSTDAGLFELARIHRAKGRLDEAERTLKDLLFRMTGTSNPTGENVEHAIVLIELADVQAERGDGGTAEEELKKAIDILDRSLGVDSEESLGAKEKLLALYVKRGAWHSAEPVADQLQAWMKRNSGVIRSKLESRSDLVAKAYVALRRYEEAAPLLSYLLARQLENFSGTDNGILWTLKATGETETALNHPAEAERAFKDYHRHLLAIHGSGSAAEIDGLYALGHFYARRGFYPPAERQLRKAFVLAQTIYGIDDPSLIPILEELEFALKGLRNDPEAAEIRDRRLQLEKKVAAAAPKDEPSPSGSAAQVSEPASKTAPSRPEKQEGAKAGEVKRR